MISYFYLDKLRLVLFEIGQILKACRLRHFYACGNISADICGAVGVLAYGQYLAAEGFVKLHIAKVREGLAVFLP